MENQINNAEVVQPIKKSGKKAAVWIIGILIILAIILFFLPNILGLIFSKDDAKVDMTDVTLGVANLKDSENSYSDLIKIDKVLDMPKEKPTTLLSSYADGSKWDEKDVQDLLAKNSQALNYFTSASQKNSYQDTAIANPAEYNKDTKIADLSHIRTTAYLSDMKARVLLKQGRTDEAITEVFKSIKIGNQLNSTQGTFIHYLVGVSLKNIALLTLQDIINTSNLSLSQMISINAQLNQNYDDGTGLAKAFRFEGNFMIRDIDSIRENREDFNPSNVFSALLHGDFSRVALQNPANKFYMKINKTKNLFTDYTRNQISLVGESCVTSLNRNYAYKAPKTSSPLLLFTENAMGKYFTDNVSTSINSIFGKRCEANFLISSTKALIAIKAYKNDTGKYPQALSDLIPKYFAGAPKDPFDNGGVKYSATKKIIYSVGKNGSDLGGSEGVFSSTMENPTIKIGF